ncbi:MAG: Uma2 family endonuclease [Leptolyngbyaceae cyanobacterium]
MTQAARERMTFQEYASLDAEDWVRLGLPEGRCEFWDGELIEVPSESEPNDFIARYLLFMLASKGVIPLELIAIHTCEIEVPGRPRTRYPDLVILREEHLGLTQRRLLITLTMPAPRLVAEVVSPGNENRRRDYEAKRRQYQDRGIPEYWLLDRDSETIEVLQLKDGQYNLFRRFQGDQQVQSPTFPSLGFTAEQVFSRGING